MRLLARAHLQRSSPRCRLSRYDKATAATDGAGGWCMRLGCGRGWPRRWGRDADARLRRYVALHQAPVGVGNTDHIKLIIGVRRGLGWGAVTREGGRGREAQWYNGKCCQSRGFRSNCAIVDGSSRLSATQSGSSWGRGRFADRVSGAAERLAGCIKLVRSNRSH